MEYALNEVKIQAKKLLKALKSDTNLVKVMQIPLKKVAVSSLDEGSSIYTRYHSRCMFQSAW
ncbi:MAG: hypothetical protein RPR97_18535 [Colwellia sp.]